MKSLSKPIYDRLARLSRKKLDKMEMEHNVHFEAFSNQRATKVDEIQSLERKLEKLRSRAIKEKSQSVAKALGTAVEMRRVRTDLLIARSVLSVLRSNQFHHRLMMMLCQDIKAGVQYDPSRISQLVPTEFSDLVRKSITSTEMGNVLGELRSELRKEIGNDGEPLEYKITSNNGMYRTEGQINGKEVNFLIDTGASSVAMGSEVFDAVGGEKGESISIITASDEIEGFSIHLDEVRVGDIVLRNVKGSMSDSMHDDEVLLGASFLNEIEIEIDDDVMTLRQTWAERAMQEKSGGGSE